MRNLVHLYWMYLSAVARRAHTVSTVMQHWIVMRRMMRMMMMTLRLTWINPEQAHFSSSSP